MGGLLRPRLRRAALRGLVPPILLAAALLISPATGATTATAAEPATKAEPTSKAHGAKAQVEQAQAQALVAKARVDAVLQLYQDASARVVTGITALTAAYSAAADAEVSDDEAAAQARRAAIRQSEEIQAMYVDGGPIGLAATILNASSADDALWRASMANRALASLFADTSNELTARTDQAALTRERAVAAATATQAQARALQTLQHRSAIADQALDQARKTLADLDAQARNASAALASAREIAAAEAGAQAARQTAMGTVTALGIPAEYERAYRAAATTCPGMPWTLLAGVGQVESGHGRNDGPSSAGAIGPMQFMPATFAVYAVDGDHDGVLDPWDPQDAIFTAAHYLCVSGAEGGSAAGIHAALLTYNHAEWYVELVLAADQAIIRQQAELRQ